MKKLSFACLPLLLLFFSCKKEKATCDLNSTNIVGSYKATAVNYKATPSSTPIDILALSDACDKDNIITLNANGTYTYQDAGVKCDPTSDDTGTWSLNNNALTVDSEAGVVTSFDCSSMVLTRTDSDGGVTTQTLAKQ
jgi:hypothetical protein